MTLGWRPNGDILVITWARSWRLRIIFHKIKVSRGEKPLVVRDVLIAMIQAHEIQGVLALENSFNRVGLDHVFAGTACVNRCRISNDGGKS